MGALEASKDRDTGKASRADQGAREPMADQGAREPMVDQGAWAAMADQEAREAMVGPTPRPRPQPPPLRLEPYYTPQKIFSFFLTESALKKQQSRTDAPFLFHLPRKESDIFFPHLWPVNILIAIAIVLHVYSMYVFGNLCVARLSCFLSLSVNSHY